MLSFLCCLWLLGGLASCVKEPLPPPEEKTNQQLTTNGVYVLNEGVFNMNNSSLSHIAMDEGTIVKDYFYARNSRKLGDTGNDMQRYGSKIYIVLSVSSQVEVIDAASGESLRQIPFFQGTKSRQPRNIAFHDNKAFVCSFDGTVAVIDTASLSVEKYIAVGKNPDGIAVSNGKVYVSNSGGLDYPNYDSTVSVIDAHTYEEIVRITVGLNPYAIVPDRYGKLYVVCRGNYGSIPMSLKVIDSGSDEVETAFPGLEEEVLGMAVQGDTAYLYYHDHMAGTGSRIMILDLLTGQLIRQHFVTDGTVLQTVYGITTDPITGNVWVADAKDMTSTGTVHCFSSEGKRLQSYGVGINPAKMVVVE